MLMRSETVCLLRVLALGEGDDGGESEPDDSETRWIRTLV
jgi:hypothetical protein